MPQVRQAWYLNELGAILQVLNYGYIEAVVACGQGQRAASHAGAHTRVLGESFAQVASGFWVLRPVTGEEGGSRRSVQGQQLSQQTHTHTHTPTHTQGDEQRARQKSWKHTETCWWAHHITKEQGCPGLGTGGTSPSRGQTCPLTGLPWVMWCPQQQALLTRGYCPLVVTAFSHLWWITCPVTLD